MNAIDEQRAVVASSAFTALVAGLRRPSRTAWDRVRRIALRQDRVPNASDAPSQILLKIRNSVAFHYSANKLSQSYEAFFASGALANDGSIRDQAIVSDGDSMEGTRFYFAEAAMSHALVSFGLDPAALGAPLTPIASDVSFALKHIVMAYIRSVATPTPYPRPGRPSTPRVRPRATRGRPR